MINNLSIISIDIIGNPCFYYDNFELFPIALIPLFFVLILKWVFKIKKSDLITKEKYDLGNYILSFEAENLEIESQIEPKKVSILAKIVVVLLSLLFVLVPFFDLLFNPWRSIYYFIIN